MHGDRSRTFGPSHEKDKEKNERHEDGYKLKGIVEGQHMRLPLQFSVDQCIGIQVMDPFEGKDICNLPLSDHVRHIEWGQVFNESRLVELGPPGENGGYKSHAHTPADVP